MGAMITTPSNEEPRRAAPAGELAVSVAAMLNEAFKYDEPWKLWRGQTALNTKVEFGECEGIVRAWLIQVHGNEVSKTAKVAPSYADSVRQILVERDVLRPEAKFHVSPVPAGTTGEYVTFYAHFSPMDFNFDRLRVAERATVLVDVLNDYYKGRSHRLTWWHRDDGRTLCAALDTVFIDPEAFKNSTVIDDVPLDSTSRARIEGIAGKVRQELAAAGIVGNAFRNSIIIETQYGFMVEDPDTLAILLIPTTEFHDESQLRRVTEDLERSTPFVESLRLTKTLILTALDARLRRMVPKNCQVWSGPPNGAPLSLVKELLIEAGTLAHPNPSLTFGFANETIADALKTLLSQMGAAYACPSATSVYLPNARDEKFLGFVFADLGLAPKEER